MYTFILSDKAGKTLEHVSRAGNEAYLRTEEPRFRHLSDVGEIEGSSLNSGDMGELLDELSEIARGNLDDAEREHVRQLIALAQRCALIDGVLTIAPLLRSDIRDV